MRLRLLGPILLYLTCIVAWPENCQKVDEQAVAALKLLNRAEARFWQVHGHFGRPEELLEDRTLQDVARHSPEDGPLIDSMIESESLSLPGHILQFGVEHDSYILVVRETAGCKRTYVTDERKQILQARPLPSQSSPSR